jgi:hypothetical protein
VVELTRGAHFDGVTLDGLKTTLKFEEFRATQWASPTRWEPRPENVGNFHEFAVFAQRTRFTGVTTYVFGRPQ